MRKIRRIMKFRNFQQNISWTVDMTQQISELMMLLPHFFHIIILYIKYWKFEFIIAQTCKKPVPI